MSRIGKKPAVIPAGIRVTVEINPVTVKGPKGELSREYSPAMAINVEGNELTVTRPNDEKASRAIHGTTRALIANMVEGVSYGFAKTLDI
jgi:large subunit ribosomal protein L6